MFFACMNIRAFSSATKSKILKIFQLYIGNAVIILILDMLKVVFAK